MAALCYLLCLQVPVVCDLGIATDVSWHPRIPLVGVAAGRQIKCWAVET